MQELQLQLKLEQAKTLLRFANLNNGKKHHEIERLKEENKRLKNALKNVIRHTEVNIDNPEMYELSTVWNISKNALRVIKE